MGNQARWDPKEGREAPRGANSKRYMESKIATIAAFRFRINGLRKNRPVTSVLVGQQLALLFVRQWLCGVILQIGRKMLRGAHPQNSDADALDAERELERRFER